MGTLRFELLVRNCDYIAGAGWSGLRVMVVSGNITKSQSDKF